MEVVPGETRCDLSLSLIGVAVEEVFNLDIPDGELILPDLFLGLVWGVWGPITVTTLLRL